MGLLKIKRKDEKRVMSSEKPYDILPCGKDELGISDEASLRIKQLLNEKGSVSLYLRVAIRGGGCSGLSIHYEFTETMRENDLMFSHNDAHVIIDKKSLSILGGSTLHCRDYLGSKEFMLENNPAAKQCSCGQSFAL